MVKSIRDMILAEFRERKCSHVDIYPPFFIASIGAHLLNIENRRRQEEDQTGLFYMHGKIPDMRQHLMFVAPAGFSKTFWLEQFLRDQNAILYDTNIDIQFEGMMSEAGWVGTIRMSDGASVEVPGAARLYADSIVGIEEFSIITDIMSGASFGAALGNQLLTSLDSGYVYKHLAAGKIQYRTNVTLQCGTQPVRFDLGSGLARRFFFLLFIPSRADVDALRKAFWDGINVRWHPKRLNTLRRQLDELIHDLQGLKHIRFDDEVREFIDQTKVPHYEIPLYLRMLMGECLLSRTTKLDDTLEVKLDDLNKEMINLELFWRDEIKKGSEYAQIRLILREHNGEMPEEELISYMAALGNDAPKTYLLIGNLTKMKVIKRERGRISLSSYEDVKDQWQT